ncbi:MAG: CrcB family protein [Crocinitomicaceae bacterium]
MELLRASLLIFFGGGLGSLLRFAISRVNTQLVPSNFPTGTLIANVLACTILGLIVIYSKGKLDENIWLKYFLVIGFCGGFSTFSTFGYETVQLFRGGYTFIALANIAISLSVGFLILWVFTKS